MQDTQWESVVLLAKPYLEIPYAELPEILRQHVVEAFHSRPDYWDTYSVEQRRVQIDRYDLKNNPERAIECAAEWYDTTMDASAWWLAESITPIHAAMLLCQHNPNQERVEVGETNSNLEMGPDDFRRLKNTFEGALDTRKSLSAWTTYARDRGLKIHTWIETWEEWIRQTHGAEGTIEASSLRAATTGKVSTHEDRTEAELLRDQIKAIALELYDTAENQGWGTDKDSIAKALERVCAERKITTRLKKKLTSAHMSRHMLTPWDIPKLAEAKRQK
jgi:hypothetical protein